MGLVWYNEPDEFARGWLRGLVGEGLLPGPATKGMHHGTSANGLHDTPEKVIDGLRMVPPGFELRVGVLG